MILVYVEPIPDLNDLAISKSQGRVFERGKRVMGPATEAAIASAVRLGGEQLGLIVGTDDDTGIARRGLALGLNRVILVAHAEAREFDGLVRARIAARMIRETGARLVLIESGLAEVAFRISEATGLRVGSLSSGLEPAILRVGESSTRPRIPSAIDIVHAAKKEIVRRSADSLGLPADDLIPRRVVRATRLVQP